MSEGQLEMAYSFGTPVDDLVSRLCNLVNTRRILSYREWRETEEETIQPG